LASKEDLSPWISCVRSRASSKALFICPISNLVL